MGLDPQRKLSYRGSTKQLRTDDLVILVWFVSAVLIQNGLEFALWLLLRRRGVKMKFWLTGIPGHMDRAYYLWCKSHGVDATRMLVIRGVTFVNMYVAAIVALYDLW